MTDVTTDFQHILYEAPADHVARIVLNRPNARNAQDTKLLYELNAAFDRAAQAFARIESYYSTRKERGG